jgi:hypothetical protein
MTDLIATLAALWVVADELGRLAQLEAVRLTSPAGL